MTRQFGSRAPAAFTLKVVLRRSREAPKTSASDAARRSNTRALPTTRKLECTKKMLNSRHEKKYTVMGAKSSANAAELFLASAATSPTKRVTRCRSCQSLACSRMQKGAPAAITPARARCSMAMRVAARARRCRTPSPPPPLTRSLAHLARARLHAFVAGRQAASGAEHEQRRFNEQAAATMLRRRL